MPHIYAGEAQCRLHDGLHALLRDKSVSLRAKGLYTLMFSKPNGWIFHEAASLNESTEGRDALRAAMKELLGARWIEKRQPRDGGQFRGNIFSNASHH